MQNLPVIALHCQDRGVLVYNYQKRAHVGSIPTELLLDGLSSSCYGEEFLRHEHASIFESQIVDESLSLKHFMQQKGNTIQNQYASYVQDLDSEAVNCRLCQALKYENNYSAESALALDLVDHKCRRALDCTTRYSTQTEICGFFDRDTQPGQSYPQLLRKMKRSPKTKVQLQMQFINAETTLPLLSVTNKSDLSFRLFNNPTSLGETRQVCGFKVFPQAPAEPAIPQQFLDVLPCFSFMQRIQLQNQETQVNSDYSSFIKSELFGIYIESKLSSLLTDLCSRGSEFSDAGA